MTKTRSVYKINILKFNKYMNNKPCDKCKEIECICKDIKEKQLKEKNGNV